MTYTAVPDVAEGDSWTAKDMNKYVRDNFAAGIPDIFTTKGDIAVATGNNAAVRVGVNNNDELLMADDGQAAGVIFSDGVINMQYSHSGGVDSYITTGSNEWNLFVTGSFDTLVYDNTDSAYDVTTFTTQTGGYYLVGFGILRIDAISDTGLGSSPYHLLVAVRVNDTLKTVLEFVSTYNDPDRTFKVGGFDILQLDTGDTMTFYSYINTKYSRIDRSNYTKRYPLNIVRLQM